MLFYEKELAAAAIARGARNLAEAVRLKDPEKFRDDVVQAVAVILVRHLTAEGHNPLNCSEHEPTSPRGLDEEDPKW